MDKIILEQVYQAISAGVKGWLSRNRPPSLTEATRILENFFGAEKTTSA